jgi:hypothetical protein
MSETQPEIKRSADGTFAPGAPSANPGGRPKRLVEIEAMLNEHQRTPERVKQALDAAFLYGIRGEKGDAKYLDMWFNRVLGPVKELIPEDWLADAPPAVLDWLRRHN